MSTYPFLQVDAFTDHPLAGHPTIATTFALVDSGRLELTGDTTRIFLELKHGPIPVEIHAQNGKVRLIVSRNLFCLSGATPVGKTFVRPFGTPPDLIEDPFTGSATGGMAAYLWRYGLIQEPRFIAEQGHWMSRPGRAMVEIIGSREDIETVKVGGEAVSVLRGELLI